MKIVTISREFGSGGRELGKRLADTLGFDYYDREIITAIAQAQGMDERYVEKALEGGAWQRVPLTYGRTFATGAVLQSAQTSLLVEQRQVIEGIAKTGRDCVIVGRDADILLAGYKPFTIFVCADMEAKVRRCIRRAAEGENLSPKAVEQNIRRIDKARARSREMISDSRWGQGGSYHMTVNTSSWDIKELTGAVADFARRWFARAQ
ncbi:MAG: cytidylate kinase-like family protein [Clostridiales bacterium]|nr:cytidylate kinase-like family protein [Clostridiales bacterium]